MVKKRSKVQKRLAKVVMAALLCTNAAQAVWVQSVAEATEITITDSNFNSLTELNSTYNVFYPKDTAATTVNVNLTSILYSGVELTGGYSQGTDVQGKTVNFTSGTVNSVSGGTSGNGLAEPIGNTVNVTGGKVTNVFGGRSFYSYVAHQSFAEGNTVTISGDAECETVCGAMASGNADIQKNTVNISGGTVKSAVMGGYSKGGYANENTVNITGGTVTDVIGGYSKSAAGSADGNTVNINGGTISEGTSLYAYIRGGTGEGNISACNNTITIKGDASVSEKTYIYGGVAFGTSGVAANNTVNILKAITVAGLYGGLGDDATKSIGNTLNIAAKNVVANDVAAFQNMNFYLPKDIANNDTMLTIKGNEGMTTPADVKGVTFGVAALQGVNLQKGDTVNLLVGKNGLTTDDELKKADSASLGSAAFLAPNNLATDSKYELSISKKGTDTILATVDNVTDTNPSPTPAPDYSNNERLKSLVETRAGMATMINAGTDLLTGQGMSNAAEAAADKGAGGGFNSFGAASIGKLRAESGSHVDTKGIGLNLGFARELENSKGKLLFGPVIEYGHGKYDSYQDNGIKADGHTSYWGLGILAKQVNHNGFYYEGSLRAGRVKSDYDSDLSAVTHASYDSSATYWAAHAGLGKVMDIGKDNTLDVYGKYFYSHTGSDSVTVHATGGNEDINFSAVNSHRLRIGTRLTHAINEKNRIYGGLAWQYEFNGDARATYNGGSTPSPSVKGSSGMMELGWQVKPGKGPMTIDLGVTGWAGKQRGVTANVQANWTF